MKRSVLFFVCLAVMAQVNAQPGKTPVTANPLKNTVDSASYAIGLSVINFYKQQGVTKLNASMVTKAMTDLLSGKKSLLSDSVANVVLNDYMIALKTAVGQEFLKKNKLRPGVKVTASGLQYEIVRDATGPKPTAVDSVTCNYRGTLLNNPTPFDDSYSRGQPITFSLGGVIKGWTEGLQLMSVGSKYKFYVPYYLGYGLNDYGPIPGGSMLTFEVELLDIKKKQ